MCVSIYFIIVYIMYDVNVMMMMMIMIDSDDMRTLTLSDRKKFNNGITRWMSRNGVNLCVRSSSAILFDVLSSLSLWLLLRG